MSQQINLQIVPVPKMVNNLEGKYSLPGDLQIHLKVQNETEHDYAVEIIKNTLRKFCMIASTTSRKSGQIIIEQVAPDHFLSKMIPKEMIDEAYQLQINSDGIFLSAVSSKGIFYGTMTLVQLLEKANDKLLPQISIIDFPDMKIRGISDDISRGQVSTIENFKRIIDFMARYKMNTYMPYLEDMLVFDKYPEIGKGRGALTKNEVKQIISYANKNFIEVIPIFQTLGHFENILSQPEFLKYAEFPGAASLCVSNEDIYSFLEEMLKEVFELFPSEYFHMGADESYDVGLGKSKYLADKYGLAKLHADHYKKVYDICKKFGKKVMMYGDIILNHPEILSMIPKDITIVDWHYRPDESYPSTKTFNKAGFNYLVSPSVWNFVTSFPINSMAIPNIKYITKSGLENSTCGIINSNWGDYGAETFKELVFYGYAWSAQCSWNFKESDIGIFSKTYFYDFFGVDLPAAENLYEIFSNTFNGVYWHEVWRHPLLPFRETVWWESKVPSVSKIEWMRWSMKSAAENIQLLSKSIIKNKEHLDIFRWLVKFNLWYKLKLETQLELENWKQIPLPNNHELIIELIEKNLSALKELKSEYKNLWVSFYKKENLNMIEDKFDRLALYFVEIKDEILNFANLDQMQVSTPLSSPIIKSDWIYLQLDDSMLSKKAEFTASIEFENLEDIPKDASVQLIGDGYTKLFINGQFVDEVYVRRSLSLWTEYKRIKMIDVYKYLKKGKNIFTVEVENFNSKGSAGFNLTSNFGIEETCFETKSQSSIRHFTWNGRVPGSTDWKPVITKDYPFPVIAPNFFNNRKSWIER